MEHLNLSVINEALSKACMDTEDGGDPVKIIQPFVQTFLEGVNGVTSSNTSRLFQLIGAGLYEYMNAPQTTEARQQVQKNFEQAVSKEFM